MNIRTKKILLTVIFIMIVLSTIVALSYAFYTVMPPTGNFNVESSANISIPACLNISVSDDKPFALSGDYAIPVKDDRLKCGRSGTSSSNVWGPIDNYKYRFTVTNNCETSANVQISLAPLSSSTMPIDAVKYSLQLKTDSSETCPFGGKYVFDNNELTLDEKTIMDIKNTRNYDVNKAYTLANVELTNGQSKTYDLYLWIDYYEGDRTQSNKNNNVTMNKTFSSIVILSEYASVVS